MLKKLLQWFGGAVFGVALGSCVFAYAAPATFVTLVNSAGQLFGTVANPLVVNCNSGCSGSVGAQDVNLTKVGGADISLGSTTASAGLPMAFPIDQVLGITGSVTATGSVTIGAGSAVIGHVIADTGSTTAVTALPATPAGTNNIGKLDSPCNLTLAINQTTSTDILTSTNKIHFCEIKLISASQQGLSVIEGTGTLCASGQGLLEGGATGTMQVAANGGYSDVSGIPFKTSKVTADHICIIQTGAGNVSGSISYGDY